MTTLAQNLARDGRIRIKGASPIIIGSSADGIAQLRDVHIELETSWDPRYALMRVFIAGSGPREHVTTRPIDLRRIPDSDTIARHAVGLAQVAIQEGEGESDV